MGNINNNFKASKLGSIFLALLLILVTLSAVNVDTTSVTNNNAPAAYKKQSDTNVLVMNFTITPTTETLLAGVVPSVGQITESSSQAADWGNSSVGTAILLCYNPVGAGDYDWTTDCIWQENATNPNTNYNSIDTIINGTAPTENTPYSWLGCRAPTWTSVTTYDAANGGLYNNDTDAIFFGDNNNAYLDKLTAVTFKLNSSCNATNSDISELCLWKEAAGGGFSAAQDTLIASSTYSAGSSSWNVTGLSETLSTAQIFYVTVNISGSAVHYHNITMEIPTLNDQNANGAWNNDDQGLYLASTDDTGGIVNSNAILVDTFAPVTQVNSLNYYWNTTGSATLTTTATDNLSGIASVTLYYYNSSDNSTYTGPHTVSTDSAPPYTWNFNFGSYNGSGWYRFHTRGTDTVGNVEAFDGNDTECGFDENGSTVAISLPPDASYNSSVLPVNWINGTCNDIEGGNTKSGVNTVNLTIFNVTSGYYWNGTGWASGKTWLTANLAGAPYSTWNYDTSSVTWANATSYKLNATGTDNASNIGTQASSTIYYDTYAPTTTITVPTNNGYYKSGAIDQLSGTSADQYSGISTVNLTIYNQTSGYYWNGAAWASGVNWTSATLLAGYTSWTYDSSSVTWENASSYTINCTATDNASNVGTASSAVFLYDTYAPPSNVSQAQPYWYTTSGTPKTLTYTAYESATDSGLANVTLYYKYSDDNITWDVDWRIWSNSSNPDTTPWTTTTFDFNFPNASGYYEFYTRAYDNASNREDAPSNNDTILGYDIIDPTATITSPTDNGFYRSGTALDSGIEGNASDPQSISLVNLTIYNSTDGTYFNGVAWVAGSQNLSANLTGSGSTVAWDYDNASAFPSWLTNKTYIINVSAKDSAGNWNLSAASATFTYDTTVPNAPTISVPIDATWYSTLTNISGTSQDDGGSKTASVNIMIYNSTGGRYWNGVGAWVTAATNISANVTGTGWLKNWYYSDTGTFPSTFTNASIYIVNASAVDNAGNRGSNDSNTFYWDDDGLTSSVTAITPYWSTTSPISVSYTAQDSGSGLHNATLYYRHSTDNATWGSWTVFGNDSSAWDPTAFVFNTPNSTGHYQFYTIVTDNSTPRNTETEPGGNGDAVAGYDANDPTVTISPPDNANYYTTMNWINGTCADTGYSGINRVNFTIYNATGGTYWNGTAWESGSNWTQSTVAATYDTWSYDASSVTWQNAATYVINATAVDNATRTSTVDSNTFYIDTTAPTVTIEFNQSTYITQGDVVRIYANFTEATSGINESSVNITVKNTTLATVLAYGAIRTTNLLWYYDWTVPAGNDGSVNITVSATDNVSYSVSGTTYNNTAKYIDNTAPTMTTGIEFNTSETYFNGTDSVKIYANFTEATSGIDESSVTVTIKNVSGSILTNAAAMTRTTNTQWYYNWNVPSDQNCQVNISIQATDNVSLALSVNNYTTAKYIDNVNPAVVITNPTNAAYKDEDFDNITGTATDDSAGVASVTITIYNVTAGGRYWNGACWTTSATNLGVNESGTGTSITWYYSDTGAFPTWTDGSNYTINATVTDNADNTNSNNDSNLFYYDDSGPTISNVLITNVNTSSTLYISDGVTINVTANVTDANLADGDKNYIKADLTEIGVGSGATNATGYDGTVAYWNVTVVDCTPDDGTITITINASDKSGNYATEVNDTITADNTAPTLNYAILDADNDGTNYTYVDVYFVEANMDTSTIAYTDFNISISGVNAAAIQSTAGNRTTIRFDTTFQTGDSPTIGIAGSVADLAGNTITSGTVTIETFNISLIAGLNLISFPCDVTTESLTTVLSSLTGTWTIYRYNATVNQWQYYNPDGPGNHYYPQDVVWNLTGGEGYWLSLGTAQDLVGNYDLWPDPGSTMPTYTLKGQSWNLIGHWQTYNQTASTNYGGALASLSDSDVGSLWRYNAGGGYTNILNGAQNVEPAKGYWLWKESAGDKYYTPS